MRNNTAPIAPIVANIFMGHLETQALNNFMNPPRIFIRYVDDTFVIMKRAFYTEFLSFLNCLCNSIKFTMELANTDNSISFLDCLVKLKCDNTFDISVYRKPTHSDRYLNFYSAHPVHMKKAIIKSLVFRAERLCSEDSTKTSEINHLRCVLKQNSYPQKFIGASINSERPSRNTTEEKRNPVATIPYRQRTSELIRKVLSDYDIRTVFRPDNTLAKHLVHAKDPIISENWPFDRWSRCKITNPRIRQFTSVTQELINELSSILRMRRGMPWSKYKLRSMLYSDIQWRAEQ